MSISPGASIAQFAAAYAGALSSLGVSCAPQLLRNNGEIRYGGEPTGPDEPLIKIDGSRSTAARDEYVALTVPKEVIFADPKDRDINLLNPTSPFLSEIDRFDEIVDSTTINVVAEYALPAHKGPSVSTLKVKLSELKLRDVLKALFDPNVADEYREGVKRAAHALANDADNTVRYGQGDEIEAARTAFVAGTLFAGLKDDESIDMATKAFLSSAIYFRKIDGHGAIRAAILEIPAKLEESKRELVDFYLVQAAEAWEEAAEALIKEGDRFGATIAVYRGLRAAALSKNYTAMRHLFARSSEVNEDRNNTEGQVRDYLRMTLATLNIDTDVSNFIEQHIWKETYWGLHSAFGLMKDQEMIDALKPFLTVAKERAGLVQTVVDSTATDADPSSENDYDIWVEMREAVLGVISDIETVPPTQTWDLMKKSDDIVRESIEQYERIIDAGLKTTLSAAARAIVQKHRDSYVDLAYMRYLKAFESGRISGSPCTRKEFASRGEDDSHRSSIYSRFREIERLKVRPGMKIENGKIEEIKWNGMIFAKRSDGYNWVTTPFVMASEIIRNN